MKTKQGVQGRLCSVMGECNPRLVHQALQVEPDIGLLLPYNVVVLRGSRQLDFRQLHGPNGCHADDR